MTGKEELTFDQIEAEGRELVRQKRARRERILSLLNKILFRVALFILVFGGGYFTGYDAGRMAGTYLIPDSGYSSFQK